MKKEMMFYRVLVLSFLASFGGILNMYLIDNKGNAINGIMIFLPLVLFMIVIPRLIGRP